MERVTRVPLRIMVRHNLFLSKFFQEIVKNSNFGNLISSFNFSRKIRPTELIITAYAIAHVPLFSTYSHSEYQVRLPLKISNFIIFDDTLKQPIFAFFPYLNLYLSIFYYATVSLPDSVVVFGGWNGRSDLSTVAEFSATDGSWSKLGDLQQPRHGHSAITNGKTVLVIGGSGKL